MIQYSGNYLDIVQAARTPPALGSALPGLADGAKAAGSQQTAGPAARRCSPGGSPASAA